MKSEVGFQLFFSVPSPKEFFCFMCMGQPGSTSITALVKVRAWLASKHAKKAGAKKWRLMHVQATQSKMCFLR